MNKLHMVLLLFILSLASYPLAIFLFPWATEMSGILQPDGTRAIRDPLGGMWVVKAGQVFAVGFFIMGILVSVFYKKGSKSNGNT